VEKTSNNPVVSGLPERSGHTSHRAIDDGKYRKQADKAETFSRSRILWIMVYGLMMLAFAWEAGFQFNASPSTMNRMLADALSVIGFVFCIKMIWKELTERRGQGGDEA
jgi:hypothetical protein